MALKYQTVLIKISGEALKGKNDIFDKECLESIAEQIIHVAEKGVRTGIVIGGGNIWRGKLGVEAEIPQISADYVGMMATVMNALVLEATINRLGYEKVIIYSALAIESISQEYNFKQARKKIAAGYIVIFACGTGFSHFTTDTGATIRAIEIGADALLMAKNGVAGVYDSDPKVNKNAKLLRNITHQDVADKNLQVMDLTAATLAKDAKLKIEVFDLAETNSIIRVLDNDAGIVSTTIN